jgi:hypothetical protein
MLHAVTGLISIHHITYENLIDQMLRLSEQQLHCKS